MNNATMTPELSGSGLNETSLRSLIAKTLGAFILLATTVACTGGDALVDDQKELQKRDNLKLQKQYESVSGTYEGVLQTRGTPRREVEAEISVYIVHVQDGVNSDGSPKVRPSLRGRLQLIGAVSETDSLILNGDYDARTGQLTLVSAAGGGAPSGGAQGGVGSSGATNMLSISGYVVGDDVNLEVVRSGGVWGHYVGKRVSRDTSAPGSGESSDRRERLISVYKKVVGLYAGVLTTPSGERQPAELSLFIIERADASGALMPALSARYRRSDFPPDMGEFALNVDFDSVTGEVFMRESQQGGPGQPAGMIFSGRGTLQNRTLDMMFSDRRGVVGRFQAMAK